MPKPTKVADLDPVGHHQGKGNQKKIELIFFKKSSPLRLHHKLENDSTKTFET